MMRLRGPGRWTSVIVVNCNENNHHIVLGKENYFVTYDGLLMPARKNQAAPDLRYFKDAAK